MQRNRQFNRGRLLVVKSLGTLDASTVSDVVNKFNELPKWSKSHVTESVMADLGTQMTQRLMVETPVATGRLRDSTSWHYRPSTQRRQAGILYIVQGAARISADSIFPYGRAVRRGSRPHAPPIGPLILWASAKFGVSSEEAYNIGYRVRWKIALFGTEPNNYALRVVRNSRDLYQRAARELATRIWVRTG